MEKLLIKISDLVKDCETLYDIKVIYKNTVQMNHVKKLRKKLYALIKSEGIEFVHGCGKRKTSLQCSIETLEEYLSKFKEYTKKYTLAVAGIEIELCKNKSATVFFDDLK